MKYLRIFLLAILSLSAFALKAQTYEGSFGSFEVSGGKVTVTPGTTTTSITFQVICFRVANGTGWKNFKMNFKLAYELANGNRNLIDNPISVMTSADFQQQGQAGGSKQFTVTVNNSSLPVGGYLRIAYNIPSIINGVEYKAYTISDAYRYPIVAPTAPDPSPATLSKITSMGFSTTGLKVAQNYYVVENDVRLYKLPLAESSYTNWKVDNTNGQNVNIEIDESVWGDSGWYNSLLEAIRVWNTNPASNVKLNLIFSTFNYGVAPRVDITMRGTSISTPTESTFADGNGKAGQTILVKSNYISPTGDNVVNLIHAIGHTLGLKHTPTNTPDYSNSVMKAGPATVGIWSLLVGNYELPSAYDNSKITSLYPLNAGSSITGYINGPASFSSSASTTYRMSYISSENNITYSWKVTGINGTTYNYTPSENNAALYDFGLPKGDYRLQCTISGGKYTTPAVITKDIKSL